MPGSLSYELSRAGIEHVILERGRIGGSWRGRWDSFCLVTPNWTVRLPGYEYRGEDPDGFMARDQIVEHLVGYAEEHRSARPRGDRRRRLEPNDGGGFSSDVLGRAPCQGRGRIGRVSEAASARRSGSASSIAPRDRR